LENNFPVRYLYSMRIIVIMVVVCLLFISCPGQGLKSPLVIKPNCKYESIDGIARITSATWTTPEPGGTAPPPVIDLVFTFIPLEPGRVKTYRFPTMSDDNQRIRMFLPQVYLERGRKELVTGGILRCVRNEITSGTCTPVVFSFPDYEIGS
jgi:hypothetical protein